MIEIKKCNYITGTDNSISFGLSKIINFLETSGRNILFLNKSKNSLSSKSTSLSLEYLINISKINFNNKIEFKESLDNKSNLFRVDLIIADLWDINLISKIIEYKEILDNTGIDYIIITNKYHYREEDDIRIYKIEREPTNNSNWKNSEYKYIITEKIGGWKSTLDDLVVSYKRNKKIDDIFGDDV